MEFYSFVLLDEVECCFMECLLFFSMVFDRVNLWGYLGLYRDDIHTVYLSFLSGKNDC